MNKHLSSLLCLFALPVLLCAQALNWHKQLTTEAYFTPFLKLIPEGDHVRIHTNRAIFQMDQNGAVTHFLDFNAPVLTAHSATKKYLPGTGPPYFV